MLNYFVPWDSLFLLVDPSAEWGHPLCSPSPGLAKELKVMNAGRAELQGRTNTTEVQEKGSYGPLFPTTFDKWGD